MNGRTELGEVRLYHDVNLGVAVEVDDGLVVPVIRDSETRRMRTLATKLADLTARARSRDLTPLDMTDGTFTISNLGALGVEFFTPIINPPELGILGVGSLRDEVKIVGGEPQEVPTLHLSLSFDHAALDGADSARFLQLVVRHVECPESGWPDSEAVTTT
jgi:pyruvate dehydrogenase E2 component (dihydrolipoamide acetyltransferase)